MADTIKGLSKLLEQFKDLQDISFGPALQGGAYILQAESMRNAPRDTGFLINSHQSVLVNDKRAELQITAKYAVYQEFGTLKQPAHPFVRPAIETKQTEIVRYIRDSIEASIKGVV